MDVFLMVVYVNVSIWTLILVGFQLQRIRIEAKLRQDVGLTGEYLVLGPQNGYYAKTKGIAAVKSMGVMALTNKRLIFRVLFGMGFDIPLTDIADISEAKWFQGMYRNGREHMILKLRDGSEIGFQTRDQQNWAEQMRALVPAS